MADISMEIWAEVIKFSLQAGVVIVGWWVVNGLTENREREKAKRETVSKECDAIGDAVDALFREAHLYHTSPRHIGRELQIKMAITSISYRLANMDVPILPKAQVSKLVNSVIDLKIAMTANHFEDEHLEELENDSNLLGEIASSTVLLKGLLIKVKMDQFRR